MALFGLETSWGALPDLDLPAFAHTFEEGEVQRTIKIYGVPADFRASRYFIAETVVGGVEEAPASLVRETLLLVHFILPPDGDPYIVEVRPEVLAA